MKALKTLSILMALLLDTAAAQALDPLFWVNTTEEAGVEMGGVAQILVADDCGKMFAMTTGVGETVWQSSDKGDSWELIPGMNSYYKGIVLRDGTIIIGGRWRIYRSNDCGDTWEEFNLEEHGLPRIGFEQIVEGADGTLYTASGTWQDNIKTPNGLWRSSDKGESWQLVCDDEINGEQSSCVVAHPNGNIYWGSRFGKGLYEYAPLTQQCHNVLTPDDKEKWEPLALAVNEDGDMMMSTHLFSAGILSSDDNGANWKKVWIGKNKPGTPQGIVSDILVDQLGRFFVAGRVVWYTADLGETWTKLPGEVDHESVWSIALNEEGFLFAGANDGFVYRTRESIYLTTDVTPPAGDFGGMLLAPNPTRGDLRLDFELEAGGLVTCDVLDMRGAVLQSIETERLAAGSQTLDLRLGDVAPGMYLVCLKLGTKVLCGTVAVMR